MSESTNTEVIETKEEEAIEDTALEEGSEEKGPEKKWDELQFIPNKRRFIILTIVGTILELAGLFIFAYAFPNAREIGMNILGLLLVPPFLGVLISYFVQDKKEGFAVSIVNAVASVLPFMITHSLIEVFVYSAQLNDVLYFLFPILGIALQVIVAYTMSRVRNLYKMYEDPTISRESDEAMIAELRKSRIRRGLEEPPKQESESESS